MSLSPHDLKAIALVVGEELFRRFEAKQKEEELIIP